MEFDSQHSPIVSTLLSKKKKSTSKVEDVDAFLTFVGQSVNLFNKTHQVFLVPANPCNPWRKKQAKLAEPGPECCKDHRQRTTCPAYFDPLKT